MKGMVLTEQGAAKVLRTVLVEDTLAAYMVDQLMDASVLVRFSLMALQWLG